MTPRLFRAAVLPLLLAGGLLAGSPEKCFDLRGARDTAEVVGAGIQIVVTARNTCGEDFPGGSVRFRVTVRSRNGGTAGTQTGSFFGTIPAYGKAEITVFVACDPDRAGEIEVALLD